MNMTEIMDEVLVHANLSYRMWEQAVATENSTGAYAVIKSARQGADVTFPSVYELKIILGVGSESYPMVISIDEAPDVMRRLGANDYNGLLGKSVYANLRGKVVESISLYGPKERIEKQPR